MTKRLVYPVAWIGVLFAIGGCSADVLDQETGTTVEKVCALQSTTLNPPAPGPIAPGGSVSIDVGASCAINESPEYRVRYRLKGSGTWNVLRGWGGPSFAWNTLGYATGLYELRIETRAVGFKPGVQSAQIIEYAVGDYCTSATLNSSDPSPQPIGQSAHFHATATCTNGATAQFQFLLKHAGETSYTLKQDWSLSGDYVWDTTGEPEGAHNVQVRVRANGNTSVWEVKKALVHALTTCGNNVVDGTDQCDGNDFAGQTCVSLGFDLGNLSCSSSCTIDTSNCYFSGCNPFCI